MRVGAAVGLGALSPPLALVALFDAGDAPDIDCRALNEQARTQTGTTERVARPGTGKAKAKSPAVAAGANAPTRASR